MIAKLRKERDALQKLAFIDELTLLLRRSPVIGRLERELRPFPAEQRAPHRRTESVAVLAIDLVGFKRFNDTLGHAVADQALQQVARAILNAVRANDLVGRWGGDEFCVVLWNITEDDAKIVIDRILTRIRATEYSVDARIGGVVWERTSGIDVVAASLLRAADENERVLKREGRTGAFLTAYEH